MYPAHAFFQSYWERQQMYISGYYCSCFLRGHSFSRKVNSGPVNVRRQIHFSLARFILNNLANITTQPSLRERAAGVIIININRNFQYIPPDN